MEQRLNLIKITSWIGITGNLILAAVKIILGIISGSLAVVGDGIDSTTDILSFLVILFAAGIIAKAPDHEHPYGHHRAEALATIVISFIILYAGMELLQTSFSKLSNVDQTETPSSLALYATLISIGGKIVLAWYQHRIGTKTSSPMLIANSQNMFNDILVSCGVLIGLLINLWIRSPLVDPMIAILLSIWVIRTAVKIFMENYTELMEGIEDISIYGKIFEAVKKVHNAYNPHRTRIRKLANLHMIDIDIEVPPNLSVKEGHAIAAQVESEIKKNIPDVYDLSVHIEPLGNTETNEKFGVAAKPE